MALYFASYDLGYIEHSFCVRKVGGNNSVYKYVNSFYCNDEPFNFDHWFITAFFQLISFNI